MRICVQRHPSDAVATLAGCEEPKGAKIEVQAATELGLEIVTADDLLVRAWGKNNRA
jgi:hypothetical protein